MFPPATTAPLPRRMMALAFPNWPATAAAIESSASEPDRSNRLAWDRRKRRSRAALWPACRALTWSIHAAGLRGKSPLHRRAFCRFVGGRALRRERRPGVALRADTQCRLLADQAHRPRFADQERAGIKPRGTVAVGIHQAGTRQRSGSLAHLDLFLLKQVVQIVVQVVIQVFRPVVGARAYRRYP